MLKFCPDTTRGIQNESRRQNTDEPSWVVLGASSTELYNTLSAKSHDIALKVGINKWRSGRIPGWGGVPSAECYKGSSCSRLTEMYRPNMAWCTHRVFYRQRYTSQPHCLDYKHFVVSIVFIRAASQLFKPTKRTKHASWFPFQRFKTVSRLSCIINSPIVRPSSPGWSISVKLGGSPRSD